MEEPYKEFEHQQEPAFNYEEFLYKCLHYWYLFAIALLGTLLFSFFFND